LTLRVKGQRPKLWSLLGNCGRARTPATSQTGVPLISDCFFVARDRFVRLRFAQQIQMSLLRASLSVIFSKALKSRLNEMVSCKLLIVTRLVRQSAQGRKAHGSRSFTVNQALRRAKLRQRSFRQGPSRKVATILR